MSIVNYSLPHYNENMLQPQIIFESDEFLVIDKPAGLLVHPTIKKETDTLVDWLRQHYSPIATVGDNPELRPGLVHRLDKDTSGVMVTAKTQAMFEHLKRQFQNHEVAKEYLALVHGKISRDEGIIIFPMSRTSEGKMGAVPEETAESREAITEFVVERRFAQATLIRAYPKTGRPHQIRVHLHAYGHPIVGDPLYRQKRFRMRIEKELSRIFLHAEKISFKDMQGGEQEFSAPLPPELQNFLQKLK